MVPSFCPTFRTAKGQDYSQFQKFKYNDEQKKHLNGVIYQQIKKPTKPFYKLTGQPGKEVSNEKIVMA